MVEFSMTRMDMQSICRASPDRAGTTGLAKGISEYERTIEGTNNEWIDDWAVA
jgi:hypothetical protein